MPSLFYTKVKECIALALHVEQFQRSAIKCSFCWSQCRSCFLDLSESTCCSECICSKCSTLSCDAKEPLKAVPLRVVCHFFFGPQGTRRSSDMALVAPPVPLESPVDWFPAFDPFDPYWADSSLLAMFAFVTSPITDPSNICRQVLDT
jgi:hypothetical protein